MGDEGVNELKEGSFSNQLLILDLACDVNHLIHDVLHLLDRELVDLDLKELAHIDLFFREDVD